MFVRGVSNILRVTSRVCAQQKFGTVKSLKSVWTMKTGYKMGLLGLIGAGVAGFTSNQTLHSDEYYEKVIPADFAEGEKREVQVGPKDDDLVLVCKVEGVYYCVSNKCPHFGAPLGKGPLFNDKIVCPFHNASFSVKDGAAEGGPMLNGLERFEVTQKDGQLHIRVNKSKLNIPRPMDMVKPNPDDKRNYVIVGGGASSLSAAETLRQSGYTGKITIISKEKNLPYDRTVLSKAIFQADVSKLLYRSKEFLQTYGIEIMNSVAVDEINAEKGFVQTSNKMHIHYDKLLIASGASPRTIPLAGADSKNVFTLRSVDDLPALRTQLEKSKKLVVIGASFIGLETAASVKDFLKDKIDITVVDISNVPYERILGTEVGNAVKQLHIDNGIKFNLGVGIHSIETENGLVKKIQLADGTSLEADAVLLGAGVTPNTGFVGQSVEKDSFGGLKTDCFLQTSDPNIFAAGDVASYPYHYTGQRARFEHINTSIHQGYIAALNMLGQKTPMSEIPFFWTRFWNKSLHYAGYASSFDSVHIDGDLKKLEFIAWYIKNDRILAVSAMNKGPVAMLIQEAMKQNVMPSATEIKSGVVKLEDIKKRVDARGRNCKCSRVSNCCKAQTKDQTCKM